MFLTFLSTALLAFLCSPAFGSAFNVSTPVFTQCAPAELSWDSTYGPFDVLIANQSDPCGYAVADLGVRDNNSVNWTVTIPEGWYVVISVEDASGEDGWSEPILVQASDNTSCLPPELAYLAEHPGPTTTSSSGGPNASASASAAAGSNNGNGGSQHHKRLPSSAALYGTTIAIAAIVASSSCLTL